MSIPVTEQFLSAARTTELLAGKAALDHTHGGGGGGGILGVSESWTSPTPLRSSGEGGIDESGMVWGAPYNPDGGTTAAGVSPATFARLNLTAAGYYNVVLTLTVRAVGLTYVRMGLNAGASLAGNHEIFAAPVPVSGGAHQVALLHNLGPIYSDGTAYIQPEVRWTPGVTTALAAQLGAHIVRLS